MDANTNTETATLNTNNTNKTENVNLNSKDDDDLDTDDCICRDVWKQVVDEQESLKNYLQDVIDDHPSIVQDVLQELGIKNEELTREIDQLIKSICSRCGRMHTTYACKNNEGDAVESNSGCDALNHQILELTLNNLECIT